MTVVIAIDAGTTGVRSFAVGEDGRPWGFAYRELTQYFPRPGWVEHDPDEIEAAVGATLAELAAALAERGETVAAIGVTNQRETAIAWDRRTGRPRHRAIVWQDRRTSDVCAALREQGAEPLIRRATGLVLDPYFSATKFAWLLGPGGVGGDPDLALGTVDSWVCWKLTRGEHVTDPSNASRTSLYDIRSLRWSDELCDLFGVPACALAEVRPSSGRVGMTEPDVAGGLTVPVSGIAGDQQAALFGQACFTPGMTKNTYGTGSFVLMNVGGHVPAEPPDGLLTTVAWTLGESGPGLPGTDGTGGTGGTGGTAYALEGAVFSTGSAIQWLRDGLGIIDRAAECGPLAAAVTDTEGVYLVPAFTGLGSPWWDPEARGAIVGLTRSTGRAQVARAVVEAMAHQVADVITAMEAVSGVALGELRVDGGASVMDVLCQFQADLVRTPVRRSAIAETTALGAAYLAGLAEGVWSSTAEIAAHWHADGQWAPTMSEREVGRRRGEWSRAVERARGFPPGG